MEQANTRPRPKGKVREKVRRGGRPAVVSGKPVRFYTETHMRLSPRRTAEGGFKACVCLGVHSSCFSGEDQFRLLRAMNPVP